MDQKLTDQEWLKVMQLVDPTGHSERILQLQADRYGVTLGYLVNVIQDALLSAAPTRRPAWAWTAINDLELMAAFDDYRDNHNL
jgi:hypothetical protein